MTDFKTSDCKNSVNKLEGYSLTNDDNDLDNVDPFLNEARY